VEQLDYFAQVALKPAANDVENFLAETRDITEYIEALFTLLAGVPMSVLDDSLLRRCHHLGWALAQEARHRVELADGALELREKRLAEEPAESAQAPAKKEG
jgi:hypothetical protein